MEQLIITKENLKSLKSFVVKRFILLLCVIAVAERMIYVFYENIIFPLLSNLFENNQVDMQYTRGGMLLGVVIYLVLVLIKSIFEILPSVISMPLVYLFDNITNTFFNVDTKIFVLNQAVPEKYKFIIQTAIIAILLLLLFIAILPYAVAILYFSKTVSRKVQEQEMVIEKQRNLLLADIAHDLKTPLTTITGYSQALRDGVETDEKKKREYLNNIYIKSLRVDEMVSFLFEYVKLQSDGFKLVRKNQDISEILRENVAMLYMDFENKKIELNVEIPEKPIYAYIDRIQISRAITNILNNSLKHNESGDTVYIKLRKEEDIEIIIADNGKQIEENIAKTIFEPFAMGDASRNSKNGSGLGLSISYKIVKLHDGNLELNRISTKEYTKSFIIHL